MANSPVKNAQVIPYNLNVSTHLPSNHTGSHESACLFHNSLCPVHLVIDYAHAEAALLLTKKSKQEQQFIPPVTIVDIKRLD